MIRRTTLTLLCGALVACSGSDPTPAPTPAVPAVPAPVEAAPAEDPTPQALAAWSAVVDSIGTDQAPRALMDHLDSQVLGIHPPLQVAQVLARFVAEWGADALGTGAAQTRFDGDIVHLRWTGADPQGRPVAVYAQVRNDHIFSMGVDPRPGRTPPVLEALEVSADRMASASPPTATLDPETGEPLVLPSGVGEPGQAQVLVQDVHAEAPLTRDTAWVALGPVLDAAHGCYLDRLDAGATIEGTLRLRVEVAEAGAVTAVTRQGSALDLGLDKCARDALAPLTYAAQDKASAFEVALRFVMPEDPEDPEDTEAAPVDDAPSVPAPGSP